MKALAKFVEDAFQGVDVKCGDDGQHSPVAVATTKRKGTSATPHSSVAPSSTTCLWHARHHRARVERALNRARQDGSDGAAVGQGRRLLKQSFCSCDAVGTNDDDHYIGNDVDDDDGDDDAAAETFLDRFLLPSRSLTAALVQARMDVALRELAEQDKQRGKAEPVATSSRAWPYVVFTGRQLGLSGTDDVSYLFGRQGTTIKQLGTRLGGFTIRAYDASTSRLCIADDGQPVVKARAAGGGGRGRRAPRRRTWTPRLAVETSRWLFYRKRSEDDMDTETATQPSATIRDADDSGAKEDRSGLLGREVSTILEGAISSSDSDSSSDIGVEEAKEEHDDDAEQTPRMQMSATEAANLLRQCTQHIRTLTVARDHAVKARRERSLARLRLATSRLTATGQWTPSGKALRRQQHERKREAGTRQVKRKKTVQGMVADRKVRMLDTGRSTPSIQIELRLGGRHSRRRQHASGGGSGAGRARGGRHAFMQAQVETSACEFSLPARRDRRGDRRSQPATP